MIESAVLIGNDKLTREQLALVPTPSGTATHRPIPHIEVVNALIETIGFRHISVVNDEYAVSRDGMKMFGVIELDQGMHGARFALGLRNSHDKSFRLAITVGYRVFVCENLAFSGDFSPVLAKHSKNFSLQNALSIGVDGMQRNFKPMVEAVDRWRDSQLSDTAARLVIYRAFVEGELEVPRHLARMVHSSYFKPEHEEFTSRTMWSLSNAFTSSFKELDPIPKYRATGKLAGFLQTTIG
ncbi:MAG TPA: DUF932 domain-containing protein [Candidatus Saccharimonadales bacterium]|nr:DUF932 domain-containing protein [Candidatus Saccharimonadales bacterium]